MNIMLGTSTILSQLSSFTHILSALIITLFLIRTLYLILNGYDISKLMVHFSISLLMIGMVEMGGAVLLTEPDITEPEVVNEVIKPDEQRFNITGTENNDNRFGKSKKATVTTYSD